LGKAHRPKKEASVKKDKELAEQEGSGIKDTPFQARRNSNHISKSSLALDGTSI